MTSRQASFYQSQPIVFIDFLHAASCLWGAKKQDLQFRKAWTEGPEPVVPRGPSEQTESSLEAIFSK